MRAIVMEAYGGSDRLQLRQMSDPRPGAGEVLIRVRAAAVNPVDWKIRQGHLRLILRLQFPYIPGGDMAGEVVAAGAGVTGWQAGDPVVGFADLRRGGAYAELAVLRQGRFARKTPKLSYAEAATLPIAACTALQALRDLGHLSAGGQALILGGAGGVGHFGVQIAKAMGATVTATCGPANLAFVRGLGADRVVDYHQEDVTAGDRRYDVILDAVAKGSFRRCRHLLAPGGTYVTTLPAPDVFVWDAVERLLGILRTARRARAIMVRPTQADLAFLGQLAEEGKLKPLVSRVYPLAEAALAQEASQAGHTQGKIVIAP